MRFAQQKHELTEEVGGLGLGECLSICALPRSKRHLINISVISIAGTISVHLEMDAKAVRACLRHGIEGLVDAVRNSVEGERNKYSFAVVDRCKNSQVIPGVSRWSRAWNAGGRPASSGSIPNTENALMVRALH